MLTAETKRHIDSARQILVGKVPDPKQQIDQITNALIYKFMDDMDVQAKDAGGKPSFFTGDLEKYAWRKLMANGRGAQERLNLYTEALERFSTAEQLPPLFRDIFRQAFLPYRDPETLNLFLKEIEFFDYSHSEELGNAFEYLLSIMGSQGDAGQFRTPRHIIDFIVDIINPDADDTILDPACGTAGFLISAYKHVVQKHEGKDAKPLTHSQKQKLMANLEGYDISSDMVKLARVNMYLHGNNQPKIYEYDTLSSEERWGDSFDVIMANPPFMSPKGGIRPHKKFGVESSRAEVLFVDYIMSHLKPNGRAGIIVPEGIIFQSGKAYKQLRKALVEDGLMAVVSLPAGVFNPYSGVKTSILIFNNEIAKKKDEIIFARVENDGYSLGTQRRDILKNDLPYVADSLKLWSLGHDVKSPKITTVKRSLIAESGDYNLSASRYIVEEVTQNTKWPMVELGDIAEFVRGPFGSAVKKSECVPKAPNTYKVYEQGNVINNDFIRGEYYLSAEKFKKLERFSIAPGDILITCAGTLGRVAIVPDKVEEGIINSVLMRVRVDETKIHREYLVAILKSDAIQNRIDNSATGVALKNMFATSELKRFRVPLPPAEVQRQIIKKLDDHQKNIKQKKQEILAEEQKIKSKIVEVWGAK